MPMEDDEDRLDTYDNEPLRYRTMMNIIGYQFTRSAGTSLCLTAPDACRQTDHLR